MVISAQFPTTPPGNSPDGPLTSPFIPSPVKLYGGRPRFLQLLPAILQMSSCMEDARVFLLLTVALVEHEICRSNQSGEQLSFEKHDRGQKQSRELHSFVRGAMQDGTPLQEILDAMFSINEDDPHITASVLRGKGDLFATHQIADLVAQGKIIQELLTRESGAKVSELLSSFDMKGVADKLRTAAPTLWSILAAVSTATDDEGESKRRDRSLVFTTVCAMTSLLRSQKANNFQAVIALFLLGSGAAKREIEVFAHAGISLSYKSVMN
ncbi:hypothetical protein R3P38DRAFT_3229237 [Favolaschia claudopus]|uniref:Uncharacterized protein n=1 Tax=Favolaschia claudopus TaxID=2862362 RepID=A0AAV9ZP37_9AGAR